MTTLCGFILILTAIALAVVMLYQHSRGTVELLSLRNFAIVGFMLFQLSSGATALFMERNNRYALYDWNSAGLTFTFFAVTFAVFFLLFYQWGPIAKTAARFTPTTQNIPSDGLLFSLAIFLTIAAVIFRFTVAIPYVGIITGKVAIAFAAIAVGIAGWLWAPRLYNPALAMFAGIIGVANLAAVSVGAFGRRNLVALAACFLWGMFYARFRYEQLKWVIVAVAVFSVPGVLTLAAWTSVRQSGERPGLQEQITGLVFRSDIKAGLLDLAYGQNTGPTSLWLIENYPERYEYRHLMVVRYFLSYPVPRAWWPEKPYPLSNYIASQASIEGVRQDVLKIGPGIVGHAAAEGGLYALIVYAFVGALFLRYFDEIVRLNPHSPFVVLPIGSALGQVVGLARGETSAFAFNYVIGVVGAYASLIILARMFDAMGWGRQPAFWEHDAHDEGEYEDYGDGGQDEDPERLAG